MKRFLFALLHAVRAFSLVSWINRHKVTILSYHSVVANGTPVQSDPHKQHLPLRRFLEQLDYLEARHRIISLTEFVNATREKRLLPPYSVVITFDDGFEDFYRVAAPELERRNFHATVFVITDRAHPSFIPVDDQRYITWQQLRELSSTGIEVGSHTSSHACLVAISLENARKELANSFDLVLTNASQKGVPFSFPYGLTSDRISELVASIGYSCGIAGDLGPNGPDADVYQLSRTVIASDDDLPAFAARVSGFTWWVSALRRAIRPTTTHDEWQISYSPSGVRWKRSFDFQTSSLCRDKKVRQQPQFVSAPPSSSRDARVEQ